MDEGPRIDRREFMAAAGFAASALALSEAFAQTVPAAASPSIFDKPMRWAQLVLVENDPGTYDPKFWLDLYDRMHVDGVCLSAGGCVCYYPTQIPFHYKSKWMK